MNSLYNHLHEAIEDKIKRSGGCITYAEFMQLALYHEQHGYYMGNSVKVGRHGDFLTTSNIGDIYGKIMANWFYHIIQEQSLPPQFCEVGAGSGRFAKAFLEEWDIIADREIHYIIIETSPYHLKLQDELLKGKITQFESMQELPNFEGVIFSNELFDALPVHVIKMDGSTIFEVMVTTGANETFTEVMVPLVNPAILAYLDSNRITLKDQQRYEIPLSMLELLNVIGRSMKKGILVTVDYGYTNMEWNEAIHRDGSLRGYEKHQMVKDVLRSPGTMDITSHIHWDALMKTGRELGFTDEKLMRQDEFFISIGLLKKLEENYDPNPFSEISRRNRAIRSLILPGGMSSHFQVLIQWKDSSALDSN